MQIPFEGQKKFSEKQKFNVVPIFSGLPNKLQINMLKNNFSNIKKILHLLMIINLKI